MDESTQKAIVYLLLIPLVLGILVATWIIMVWINCLLVKYIIVPYTPIESVSDSIIYLASSIDLSVFWMKSKMSSE